MLRQWLDKQHGVGAANQSQFYRCQDCRRLITWKVIRAGGHRGCRPQIRPAYPTIGEKFRLLAMPWTMR